MSNRGSLGNPSGLSVVGFPSLRSNAEQVSGDSDVASFNIAASGSFCLVAVPNSHHKATWVPVSHPYSW